LALIAALNVVAASNEAATHSGNGHPLPFGTYPARVTPLRIRPCRRHDRDDDDEPPFVEMVQRYG
jgi:hypothetical protein